jgi:hypothetical protein
MSHSSAKRRKLDTSQLQGVDACSENNGQPTTPTRASYLSPTKSSLARSHPHLVTRSTRRSATEPRGKALLGEVLGGRSQTSQNNTTASQTAQAPGVNGRHDPDLGPVNPVSSQMNGSTATTADVTEHQRQPLRERQPAQERTRGGSASSEEPASPMILPKLVSRKEASARSTRGHTGEPELPPTPVQLGLSEAPERPRGLGSSSSPRGSKMSTGSRRRRRRSGGPATSSPLKTKARPPFQPEVDGNGEVDEDAQEASESEAEQANHQDEEDSTEMRKQRSTLESLRKELEQLKSENQQLQEAIGSDDPSEETLAMLRRSATEDGSLLSSNQDSISTYLKLFTPGNLLLTTQTETKLIEDRIKIMHNLKVEAPSPWLPNALSCVFKVTVDAEKVQIERVELKEALMAVTRRSKSTEAEISAWVHRRLAHPLHHFDVSGMIWGMGRWFNAAIERARVFQWMDLKYNRFTFTEGDQNEAVDTALTREGCIELARYLDSTQNSAISTDLTTTTGGKKFRKKLMLSWEIHLDWAGSLTSDIQISTSGIPHKAEPGLKTIFCSLIPRIGVKGAFTNVWRLMHSKSEEFQMDPPKDKRKTKR